LSALAENSGCLCEAGRAFLSINVFSQGERLLSLSFDNILAFKEMRWSLKKKKNLNA
jgi:hypothetical protein